MRKKIGLLLLLVFCYAAGISQVKYPDRLKVFIDCNNTWCDANFIKSEITLVDFLRDNQAADVHMLITSQRTGSDGNQYQLIFFGQNQFKGSSDTLFFNTKADATGVEIRDDLVQFIKLGLSSFIAKTKDAKNVTITLKRAEGEKRDSTAAPIKDPWNYWVFSNNVYGNFKSEKVYKDSRIGGDFSAKRVTEELKVNFEVSFGRNRSSYELEDSNGNIQKIIIKNDDYNFEHFLIKSINSHWSAGYQLQYSHNSFVNLQSSAQANAGLEYDIFPYKEVNNKLITISYMLDFRRNKYIDTTLYEKTEETLWGQGLNAKLNFIQKWGNVNFGLSYHNYLQRWKYFNLGANTSLNIRITGGLSFNLYISAELTRDQLYLPKSGATAQEVLTRQRQLASGYHIETYFGLNYRFGSKLNNFVNPRFD